MGRQKAAREEDKRTMPSWLLQLALLAVVVTHGLATVVELGADDHYAGPDGYAASAFMPKNQSVLRFVRASKEQCRLLCNKDPKCKGFKFGGGGCSLMAPISKEAKGKGVAKKAAAKARRAKERAAKSK